jgi:hypothetical protein
LLSFSCAFAEIPHLINYQGRLTDTAGVPLNGSYNLTFRIYDAETAGNLLWEETQTGVIINKGIFAVLLGSVTNLNLAFDKPYFLEIKVGNEVMSPRQRITSAGYAIRAEVAESAERIGNGNPPGNSKYYGTDTVGAQGWYSLPSVIKAVGTSNISTSSTSYVDIMDMSVTINDAGTYLLMFSSSVYGGFNTAFLAFNVDGTNYGGSYWSGNNPEDTQVQATPCSFQYVMQLTSGNHIIKVQWKAGSGTIYQNNSTWGIPRVLMVLKIS